MPGTSKFVNPYTFVRIPETIPRRRPPGHDGINHLTGTATAESLHTGALTVRWSVRTPLLLPAGPIDRDDAGSIQIPGSSVKGALRSLHEAMFRGCLRVVDEDFVPSYRSAAKSKEEREWRLGIVTRSSAAGAPLKVQLCHPKVAWVDAPGLARAYRSAGMDGEPRTGDTMVINDPIEQTSLRDEIPHVTSVTVDARTEPRFDEQSHEFTLGAELPVGHRTVLITDIRARHRKTRPTRYDPARRGRCLWATAVIDSETVTIPPAVALRFAQACEGAEDRRRLLSPSSAAANRRAPDLVRIEGASAQQWRHKTQYSPVSWWPTYDGPPHGSDDMRVGQRVLVTGLVFPGEVLWVRLDGGKVAGLEHSVIWRETGTGRLADRVPQEALACTDPGFDDGARPRAGLCLSCEVFGSIDAEGDDRGGRQTAYAGHVRFGTTRAVGTATVNRIDLAPLGSPRLGAGMFSLREPDRRPGLQRHSRPGVWSDKDGDGGLRELRGRKFYWNSDPAEQQTAWEQQLDRTIVPRHLRRSGQRDFGGQRDVVAAGAMFEQTIWVDSISTVGLHSLLAALQPHRVLGSADGEFTVRLGGGKPLGLGAVTAEIISSTVGAAAGRYRTRRSAPATTPAPDTDRDLLSGWLDPAACRGLARILDSHGLGQDRFLVSYPPGDTWEHLNSATFDESFRFFTENNGQQLKDTAKPWAPLPQLPETDAQPFSPSQPIFPPAPDRGRRGHR